MELTTISGSCQAFFSWLAVHHCNWCDSFLAVQGSSLGKIFRSLVSSYLINAVDSPLVCTDEYLCPLSFLTPLILFPVPYETTRLSGLLFIKNLN
jgi:hypothetical protein